MYITLPAQSLRAQSVSRFTISLNKLAEELASEIVKKGGEVPSRYFAEANNRLRGFKPGDDGYIDPESCRD